MGYQRNFQIILAEKQKEKKQKTYKEQQVTSFQKKSRKISVFERFGIYPAKNPLGLEFFLIYVTAEW
jgi:hypothetical protein